MIVGVGKVDSLNLYIGICQNSSLDFGRRKLDNVINIVQCIFSEIMAPHYDLEKSPFIAETKKLLEGAATRISPVDAYYIVKSLVEYVKGDPISMANSDNRQYVDCLFRDSLFKWNQQNEMQEIDKWLQEIQQIAEERRRNVIEATQKKYVVSKPQPDGEIHSLDYGRIPSAIPPRSVSYNSAKLDSARSELRSNNNRANVQQWHEETSAINSTLLELQPTVSNLLQKIMSFSNDITENYVLQFAKMQIELFNLIADNYEYHLKVSGGSSNQDYINAVSNHRDFLDMIVDNMSAFGIEEIVSKRGTGFDGSIHEVVGNNEFSPRLSMVKESVRSGFKYKDIVIQKEKIIV